MTLRLLPRPRLFFAAAGALLGAAPLYAEPPAARERAAFTDVTTLAPDVRVDLRYATANNFTKHVIYPPSARCYLRRAVAQKLAAVQKQIDRGCGFLTFHFSTFAPDKYAEQILSWSGGYFDWETDGKRQWYSNIQTLDAAVEPATPDHPVLKGVGPRSDGYSGVFVGARSSFRWWPRSSAAPRSSMALSYWAA